jgi:acyl phosphate:glycerol-3-phosphate acyltransferase
MQSSWLFLLLGFCLGSLPFGHWVGLARGVDLRQQGSQNTGATNAGRILGRKWGYFVFVLDLFKGWIAVWLAIQWGSTDEVSIAAGVCAVLGHVFSPWLGFRGGKGVATSAGIFLALTPLITLILAGLWMVFFWIWRMVSVASLAVATVFPVLVFWFAPGRPILQWVSVGIAGLVWVRHRGNLIRLMKGKENKFSKKA